MGKRADVRTWSFPGFYNVRMINSRRISVVLPAYNAEATLLRTVAELDRDVIDDVVLVDDASSDQTVPLARQIGLAPIVHDSNKGYGGNQKTCYKNALDLGADVIVMVLPEARPGDGGDDRLRRV